MKAVRILLAVCLTLFAASCHTTKKAISESSTVSLTDTTKTAAHSLTAGQTVTDTTKTAQTIEESTAVEFVEAGGTISIDTAGNVTLTGVKSYKGNLKASTNEQRGVTVADSLTQTHSEQNNGVKADESKLNNRQSETETQRPAWYQAILAKIGRLCCIAALLWLLFLYLKRKF